ncbi:hypothetical protein BCR41DRAFT_363893 [Lobosporangium transversale]|uniref:Uncharacterized protein n=1 Tax=Lobosporangium transversale TaxID=64571 RepID=A0A1Y2G710_9FUNG|nr:hypothetical protein BCR41DRAFT_363893 [Lobosporangium transversale]ORY99587.1 hypothetical protein BCR41DRAFT_363893 [Lobosporangium transversale]|eukprot:XP_021875882.1 hypothetical protein BCR41DRAFT_363893 [Lobosporangium transversale]
MYCSCIDHMNMRTNTYAKSAFHLYGSLLVFTTIVSEEKDSDTKQPNTASFPYFLFSLFGQIVNFGLRTEIG